MTNRLAFISLTLAAAICSAQDLDKKLEYTTKAVTISKAFADLSQQAGTRLRASDEFANEIIVLRLKDVTLDDAMKHIASTVGAEWQKVEGGYDLERSSELAQKLLDQGLAAGAAGYKKALDDEIKLTGTDQPLTEDQAARLAARYIEAQDNQMKPDGYRAVEAVQNSLPECRALWRVLSRIDPRVIAGIESGQRIVFSNRPTNMQAQISADLSDVGVQMQQEQNLFADKLSKLKKPEVNVVRPFFGNAYASLPTPPSRFVVGVDESDFGSGYTFEMLCFDENNHALWAARSHLDPSADFGRVMADRARIAKEAESEPDLPITASTKLMLDFMKKSVAGELQSATGDFRQLLLHPDDNEPLSYATSEAFLGTAERRNENLVLYPDDSMFLVGLFAGMEGRLKPSLIMQAVQGMGQMVPTNISENDGWLTCAPANVIDTLKTRVPRSSLGEYMRSYDENGFASIASVAKLAATVNAYQFPVLDMFLPMMVNQDANPQMHGDLSMLKFYASLDDGQMRKLQSNLSLRVAELTPAQVSYLTRYVFEGREARNGMSYDNKSSFAEQQARNEPTEMLAGGLPNDTTISMSTSNTPTYFVKMSMGTSSFTQTTDINNLAWMVWTKERPEMSPGYNPTIETIEPGEDRTLSFTIGVSKERQFQSQLKEDRHVPGGPWTLDKLPDDLKKQLDAAVDRYKRMNQQHQDDAEPGQPVQTPPQAERKAS